MTPNYAALPLTRSHRHGRKTSMPQGFVKVSL